MDNSRLFDWLMQLSNTATNIDRAIDAFEQQQIFEPNQASPEHLRNMVDQLRKDLLRMAFEARTDGFFSGIGLDDSKEVNTLHNDITFSNEAAAR